MRHVVIGRGNERSGGSLVKVDTCSAVSRDEGRFVCEGMDKDGWLQKLRTSSNTRRVSIGVSSAESLLENTGDKMLSVSACILLTLVLSVGAVSAEGESWRAKVKV